MSADVAPEKVLASPHGVMPETDEEASPAWQDGEGVPGLDDGKPLANAPYRDFAKADQWQAFADEVARAKVEAVAIDGDS